VVHLVGEKSPLESVRAYGLITLCCHHLSHTAISRDSNCNRNLGTVLQAFYQNVHEGKLCPTCDFRVLASISTQTEIGVYHVISNHEIILLEN